MIFVADTEEYVKSSGIWGLGNGEGTLMTFCSLLSDE